MQWIRRSAQYEELQAGNDGSRTSKAPNVRQCDANRAFPAAIAGPDHWNRIQRNAGSTVRQPDADTV